MVHKVVLVLGLFSVTASASLIDGPTVKVLQGPSSKTSLIGPDGSVLDSFAPGGTVVTDNHGNPGLVAAGPAIVGSSPNIVVSGPAGRVVTTYTLAGPALVPAVGTVANVVESGLLDHSEGQYVPDNTELLYDDGSYKGLH